MADWTDWERRFAEAGKLKNKKRQAVAVAKLDAERHEIWASEWWAGKGEVENIVSEMLAIILLDNQHRDENRDVEQWIEDGAPLEWEPGVVSNPLLAKLVARLKGWRKREPSSPPNAKGKRPAAGGIGNRARASTIDRDLALLAEFERDYPNHLRGDKTAFAEHKSMKRDAMSKALTRAKEWKKATGKKRESVNRK